MTIPVGVRRDVGLGPGNRIVISTTEGGRIEIRSPQPRRGQFAGMLGNNASPPGYAAEPKARWDESCAVPTS